MFRLGFALMLAAMTASGQTSDTPQAAELSANLLRTLPIDPGRRILLEQQLAARDYTAAEELLAAEASRDPKSQPILLVLANVLFRDGRHLNAIVVLKKADKIGALA